MRITLGGGGTDLPSYYENHGGFLIAGAIDKYIYVTAHRSFNQKMVFRYSKIEKVDQIQEIQHPIIREAFRLLDVNDSRIEMTSIADVSAGTGLGSSGSFTTALLKTLNRYMGNVVTPEQLAEQACFLEMEKLKEPIGKQDQYAAAIGGLTYYEFSKEGVGFKSVKMTDSQLRDLEDALVIFSTGVTRSAGEILSDQDKKTKESDSKMIENLHRNKEIAYRSLEALESGRFQILGELFHEHWINKKNRSTSITNNAIDQHYLFALQNGAMGGKLIGAGGGGFLMFYSEEPKRLEKAMASRGLSRMHFRFAHGGTEVIAE